jgi:monothiol glutaredoxin
MVDVQQRIADLVQTNELVLFMKGTPKFPQCGFSGRAVQLLQASGVDIGALKTLNVLEDPELRQGIKEYSQWPTIPQLYVRGEFVGGADILAEMSETGELRQLLQVGIVV